MIIDDTSISGGFLGVRCSLVLNVLLTSLQRGLDLDGCSKKLCVNTIWLFNSLPWKITMLLIGKPSFFYGPFSMAMLNNQMVHVQSRSLLELPRRSGSTKSWLFLGRLMETKSIESQHNGHAKRVGKIDGRTESIKTQNMRFLYNRTEASRQVCC